MSDQWKIFDHLLDAIFICDREGRLYYSNESFFHLCDVPKRAITGHEPANQYIELPEECWDILRDASATTPDHAGYREVGFITKSGSVGRAQVFADLMQAPQLSTEPLFYFIIRDVTLEARLHAKYKVQIENNEHLIGQLQRSLNEAGFLRRMATELPIYANDSTMFETVAAEMKSELGFREVGFFHIPEKSSDELIAVGLDKRVGSRMRDALRLLAPHVAKSEGREAVSSMELEPFGVFWMTHFRPRLGRPVILIASARQGMENFDHRPLLETLAAQLSTIMDNHVLYFASISDTTSGLFSRRFFESRFAIECQRAVEKRMPLSLLLLSIDGFDQLSEEHGRIARDAVLTALGQIIKRRIRGSDMAARTDQGEFAVLLPDTNAQDAIIVSDSLDKQVKEAAIAVPGLGKELHVTVSRSIAGFRWLSDTPLTVYQAAHEMLYRPRALKQAA